jgi:hypothetical protein
MHRRRKTSIRNFEDVSTHRILWGRHLVSEHVPNGFVDWDGVKSIQCCGQSSNPPPDLVNSYGKKN